MQKYAGSSQKIEKTVASLTPYQLSQPSFGHIPSSYPDIGNHVP
jgi:hypothetical protein